MKVLILNWKDKYHPRAGGAEDFTFNIATRLIQKGHEVDWFTSKYEGALDESTQEGIHYIRRGSMFTTQFKARSYLSSLRSGRLPDIVIDEVNTRPFFPARFLPRKTPVVNLIHQLAREIWFFETPFPVAVLGRYWLEGKWLRKISTLPTIVVSESTREDLATYGFKNVRVVFNGVSDVPFSTNFQRDWPPLILFMGRLTGAKKPMDACLAYNWVKERIPCSMTVVGSGQLAERLKRKFPEIQFVGRITEEAKRSLLQRATFIFVPGVREGWGRVILEAQAYGVVPVAYDVPGLRDAVDFGRVGVLTNENTPKGIGTSAISVAQDPDLLAGFVAKGHEWARRHTNDAAAAAFESCLLDPNFVCSRVR